nr:PREDICTED: apoptosis-inducing factor 1, mitochondrial [Bemisia tabaci]
MFKNIRLVKQLSGVSQRKYGSFRRTRLFRASSSVLPLPDVEVTCQSICCSATLRTKTNEALSNSASPNQSTGNPPDPPDPPIGDNKTKRNAFLAIGLIVLAATVYKFSPSSKSSPTDVSTENKSKKKREFQRPREQVKVPATSDNIPDEIPYLLVGGGTASFSAFRAIKSHDPTAKVLVIGNEPYYPYMRPPLSKEIWYSDNDPSNLTFKQWNGTERSLYYEPEDFYTKIEDLEKDAGGVSVARGWTIVKVDPNERKAILEDGKEIKYEKCLIATGGKPKNLPVFAEASDEIKNKITLFRNVFDYEELCELVNAKPEAIAIIGGGFLGSELACAIAKKGRDKNVKIHQIFRENGNMGKILPAYLSAWTSKKVEKEGVLVHKNSEPQSVSLTNKGQLNLKLSSGEEITVDHIVVAVGIEPNTDLAKTSKLEVDKDYGGFLVNAELEARTDLYAAGDCACFYDPDLGRRRVEHHDHAVVSGRLAGENMTGASKPYWHQSMFWSDIGPEVGFEAIGIIDSSLPTVGVYALEAEEDSREASSEDEKDNSEKSGIAIKPDIKVVSKDNVPDEKFDKGVIFYLKDGIIVGMVLWNIFNRMMVARQILKEQRQFEDLNEVAKLFNIHKD